MNEHRSTQSAIRSLRAVIVSAVMVALLVQVGSVAVAAPAYDPSKPINDRPSSGGGQSGRKVALGMSMTNNRNMGVLDGFIASNGGNKPALWSLWSQWGTPVTRDFPTAAMNGLRDRNVTPFVFWEPWDPRDPTSRAYRYERIVAGDHDAYIRNYARDAKAFGGLLLLRFAHEANGGYFPWVVGNTDNTREQYLAAWRRIWRIFDQEGADNVKFVWSVAKQRCEGGCNPYTAFYPGDKYVDYMGFSSFNWGAIPGKQWTSMYDAMKLTTNRLSTISNKPIIVAENGTNDIGGYKGGWIRDGYREVYNKLPAISAIIYLNFDLRKDGHPDWSLSDYEEGLENYTLISGLSRFKGKITLKSSNRVKAMARSGDGSAKKANRRSEAPKPKPKPRVQKGSNGSGAAAGSVAGQKAKTTKKRPKKASADPIETQDTMQR